METIDFPEVPVEVLSDAQAVVDSLMTGKPLEPETYRRVRERGRQITEQLRQKYGELDVGVPAIRELRGELPEA